MRSIVDSVDGRDKHLLLKTRKREKEVLARGSGKWGRRKMITREGR
jgi:hypothetical protein